MPDDGFSPFVNPGSCFKPRRLITLCKMRPRGSCGRQGLSTTYATRVQPKTTPMTLRHRLMLVYLILVVLSAATVGLAILELQHAHKIMLDLQAWNEIALNVEKLKSKWQASQEEWIPELDLREELARQFKLLSGGYSVDRPYQLADRVREALNDVYRKYDQWSNLPEDEKPAQRAPLVGSALRQLSLVLDIERTQINLQSSLQEVRTRVMMILVVTLILFHAIVIGSLLRRWLLWPMEQLNRQVAALARDEPPSEPLLESPREMAALAQALDQARVALGAMRQKVIDSERLTTIGQMAAQLAHNLRNPLASIRAAAQITQRQHADTPALSQRMADIIASVDRLNRWVMGLMEIARRDPTLTQELDVIPTVERAVESVREELSIKELDIVVAVPDGPLACAHDPTTLEHALFAILTNAIEASPVGRTLRVDVSRVGRDEGGQACRIAVTDEGSGLPPDEPERIFAFSYSTKQKGMGLGLALAREALQRQGGTVHAFNNPPGGATVYVQLPLHRDAPNDGDLRGETGNGGGGSSGGDGRVARGPAHDMISHQQEA